MWILKKNHYFIIKYKEFKKVFSKTIQNVLFRSNDVYLVYGKS